jgi:type IV pilus assembly protein PilA
MMRHRLRADEGLTLVELLVVILIAGILVAVALPSLLGQRSKAQDANAKASVATAAKAATAYGTGQRGFASVTRAHLVAIEKSLETARNLTVEGTSATFEVTVQSAAGTTYSIARAADGELTRDCAPAGSRSCRGSTDPRGNRW